MMLLFAVSNWPGHLDFGGGGFVKLAKAATEAGHEVMWLSYGDQAAKLLRQGFNVGSFPQLGYLTLNARLLAGLACSPEHKEGQLTLRSLQQAESLLRRLKPDFVFLDRLLALTPLAIDQLEIPYAAVGTLGGSWARASGSQEVFIHNGPVSAYQDLSHDLASRLGWESNPVGSCWVDSPYLNISFLGRDFLPVDAAPERQANVNCFSGNRDSRTIPHIGISFGNSGNRIDDMKRILDNLVATNIPIDVFVGQRDALRTALHSLYQAQNGGRVHVHGWTDFNEVTRNLSTFVYFGGIGTVWHCINAFTPSVIVSGRVGDQTVNGRCVQDQHIGIHFEEGFSTRHDRDLLLQRVFDLSWIERCQDNIERLHRPEQFSDSWASLCQRVEKLI